MNVRAIFDVDDEGQGLRGAHGSRKRARDHRIRPERGRISSRVSRPSSWAGILIRDIHVHLVHASIVHRGVYQPHLLPASSDVRENLPVMRNLNRAWGCLSQQVPASRNAGFRCSSLLIGFAVVLTGFCDSVLASASMRRATPHRALSTTGPAHRPIRLHAAQVRSAGEGVLPDLGLRGQPSRIRFPKKAACPMGLFDTNFRYTSRDFF